MDKKIRNRILYVTVAILWSVAIYRTWKNHQIENEMEIAQVITTPPISPVQFQKDSFDLELPDRDPFLNTQWKTQNEIMSAQHEPAEKKEIQPKIITKTEPILWPKIEYFGFVKNRDKNSTLCLLKINGTQIQLQKGQSFQQVKIAESFKDSVIVVYNTESRTVKR